MKTVERLLNITNEELDAAKQLLEQDKTRAKHAKHKVARANAKRAAKLVKKTMKSIEDHQELLLEAKEKALRRDKN